MGRVNCIQSSQMEFHALKTERTLVLLGIGHTNAHIVRQWAIHPIPNCRLVCISKFPMATYSGMLPGTLAKQFASNEMEIELAPLAQRAAAELILGDVVGLDVDRQTLKFANREPLHYDTLSIGVGSMPAGWDEFDSPALIPIKPMQTFVDRLEKRLELCGTSARCVVVGGGVAGVEIALCLRARLSSPSSRKSHSISIVTSGDEIAGGMCQRSQRRLLHLLNERSIEVVKGFRVTQVEESAIADAEGKWQAADVVIWATGAVPPPILTQFGLPTDERGFLTTTSTLLTTAGYPIFVVGDSGTIESDPAPKAGVTAVRQAPVLWHNLQATFDTSRSMKAFHPQADFLKIVNTGDGKALLEYHGWTFHARWCWRLKCWIDRSFVRKYQTSR